MTAQTPFSMQNITSAVTDGRGSLGYAQTVDDEKDQHVPALRSSQSGAVQQNQSFSSAIVIELPCSRPPQKTTLPALADLLAFAHVYAGLGWPPIALGSDSKVPTLKGWPTQTLKEVVGELERIAHRYSALPNLGIGMPAGFLALDIDCKNGSNGYESLAALEAKHGSLPKTLTQHTPHGGEHRIYRLPPGVKVGNKTAVMCGLDIRGEGGMLVTEPSRIGQAGYGWMDWDVLAEPMPAIADAPDYLIALAAGGPTSAPSARPAQQEDELIGEGRRNDVLFRKASAMRGAGFKLVEIEASLHGMNRQLCTPPLPAREVTTIAHSAARYEPNPFMAESAPMGSFDLRASTALALFVGEPKPVQWLVHRIFPLGKAIILASPPGIGKSFLTLQLGLYVAQASSDLLTAASCFGGRVATHGRVVIISAEDDLDELHRRLFSLLEDGELMPAKLHVVSLPDRGHFTFVTGDPRKGLRTTAAWLQLKQEIKQLGDVRLVVVDTLQALSAGDLNAAEIAQATMNELTELANQTGAAVIALHHLVKGSARDEKGLLSAHQAMDAVRGSGAISGSARAAYCLFPHPKSKEICAALGVRHEENKVIYGLVAKANGPANRDYTIYIREETGVLCDRTTEFQRRTSGEAVLLLDELCDEVVKAYQAGVPYAVSKASNNGLHRRRGEMPSQFHNFSADWFAEQAEALAEAGRLHKVRIKNGFQYVPTASIDANSAAQRPDGNHASSVPLKGARAARLKAKGRWRGMR